MPAFCRSSTATFATSPATSRVSWGLNVRLAADQTSASVATAYTFSWTRTTVGAPKNARPLGLLVGIDVVVPEGAVRDRHLLEAAGRPGRRTLDADQPRDHGAVEPAGAKPIPGLVDVAPLGVGHDPVAPDAAGAHGKAPHDLVLDELPDGLVGAEHEHRHLAEGRARRIPGPARRR